MEEGTVLAKIDDSVYAAELAVAQAQFEQTKAGELSAAANLEQTKAKVVQAEAEWKGRRSWNFQTLIAIRI